MPTSGNINGGSTTGNQNGGNGGNGGGINTNLVAAILGAIFGIMALLLIGLLLYCCLPRCYTPVALLGIARRAEPVPAPEPAVARVVPRRRWYYKWTYGRKGGYSNDSYQEYEDY
jgi:hypothetical protein